MRSNTQFPLAVHILVALALRKKSLNSAELAWSVGTNPSRVRRMLASLAKAGLVVSRPGPTGGAELTMDPREISLLDVYSAVSPRPAVAVHEPNPACPLGAVIDGPLRAVLRDSERAAQAALAEKTVAQVARSARRLIDPEPEPRPTRPARTR